MRLFSLLFFVTFSIALLGQRPYLPMLSGDSINWSIRTFKGIDINGNGSPPYQTPAIIKKDTVIDSVAYRIFAHWEIDSWQTYNYGQFLVREDTTTQKIYAYDKLKFHDFEESEVLIYDFNLAIGDTFLHPVYFKDIFGGSLSHFYPADCDIKYLVEEVNYETYNSIERKTIYMKKVNQRTCSTYFPYELKFIEGIGSPFLFDYFNYNSIETFDWGFYGVTCFHRNAFFEYGIDSICAPNITNTNHLSLDSNDFRIAPNPVSNDLVLHSPKGDKIHQGTIAIIDLSGRVLLQKEMSFKESFTIEETANLRSGMYILSIETKAFQKNYKFLKQ